jgi:hypothetical protein
MSRLHGSPVESATKPLPRFRSCYIDITAYRRAVTEQLTLTAAEAEDDREFSATLGAFEACVAGRPAVNDFFPVSEKLRAWST